MSHIYDKRGIMKAKWVISTPKWDDESFSIRDSICRDPRTPGSVRIFKGESRDPRTAESFQIFRGHVGIHGPPNRSEFLKKGLKRSTDCNKENLQSRLWRSFRQHSVWKILIDIVMSDCMRIFLRHGMSEIFDIACRDIRHGESKICCREHSI